MIVGTRSNNRRRRAARKHERRRTRLPCELSSDRRTRARRCLTTVRISTAYLVSRRINRLRFHPRVRAFFRPLQQVTRLAIERSTERLERREADRPRLVRFQHRQVRDRDADAVGQIGERQTAIEEEMVKLDSYGHGSAQIVNDRSSSRRVPSLNTSAITRMITPLTIAKTLTCGRASNVRPAAEKCVMA